MWSPFRAFFRTPVQNLVARSAFSSILTWSNSAFLPLMMRFPHETPSSIPFWLLPPGTWSAIATNWIVGCHRVLFFRPLCPPTYRLSKTYSLPSFRENPKFIESSPAIPAIASRLLLNERVLPQCNTASFPILTCCIILVGELFFSTIGTASLAQFPQYINSFHKPTFLECCCSPYAPPLTRRFFSDCLVFFHLQSILLPLACGNLAVSVPN